MVMLLNYGYGVCHGTESLTHESNQDCYKREKVNAIVFKQRLSGNVNLNTERLCSGIAFAAPGTTCNLATEVWHG